MRRSRSFPGRLAVLLVAAATVTSACTESSGARNPVTAQGEQYEVMGADVWANVASGELPERASTVRFDAGIRIHDDGAGICLGGRLRTARLSSECDDLLIDGLEEGPWAEPVGFAPFGLRTVVVAWPPVDGRVQLQDEADLESENFAEYSNLRVSTTRPLLTLPEECESISNMTRRETLNEWAEANPDRGAYGYMGLDKDHVVSSSTSVPSSVVMPDFDDNHVFGIKGDIEAARAELSADGTEPCLVSVDYSRSELNAARDQVRTLEGTDSYVIEVDTASTFNRVTVYVAVADLYTVRSVTELVDDPAILQIIADGAVLEG